MLIVDIALSAMAAVALTELLIRAFDLRGPWRRRWSVWLVVFLAGWGGGAWFAVRSMNRIGWIGYCLPFVLVGLVAALAIAILSRLHAPSLASDPELLEREERAVGTGVLLFFWSLCALLVAVLVHGYGSR